MQAKQMQAKQCRAAPMSRRAAVRVHAAKPVVMVNSCTGKMGKAVADAAVRAGLTLAPYTLCSESEAGGKVEVAGQQLQLVGPSSRDQVIQEVGAVGGYCPLLPKQESCTPCDGLHHKAANFCTHTHHSISMQWLSVQTQH